MILYIKMNQNINQIDTMAVRCQQNLLFSSQTCRDFESDFPCFDSDIPCLESDLSSFRYSSSHFSNESFPLFKSVLLIFRVRTSHFLGSVLFTFRFSCQSFALFQVSPSHFPSQIFPFIRVDPSRFPLISPAHFFQSHLLILFSKLLFNNFEFILQFVVSIRRCLT